MIESVVLTKDVRSAQNELDCSKVLINRISNRIEKFDIDEAFLSTIDLLTSLTALRNMGFEKRSIERSNAVIEDLERRGIQAELTRRLHHGR